MNRHLLGRSAENEPNEQEIEEETKWGTQQGIQEQHSVGQHHGLIYGQSNRIIIYILFRMTIYKYLLIKLSFSYQK